MGWDTAFIDFPILETEKLLLRKIEHTDAISMYNYFSKDEVTRFYDLDTFTSKQQAIELIESLIQRYNMGNQIRWGIVLKNENTLMGTCGFHTLEKEHLKAEIGYELHPGFWGKGYMTEAIGKIIDYGFNEMKLNRIEAFYNPVNIASHKVLEKNGFKKEGIMRKRFFIKGRFTDAAFSAILKEDFFIN